MKYHHALLLLLAPVLMAQDCDQDGYDKSEDCADRNSDVHPNAIETCDGVDQDCDGRVDEGEVAEGGANTVRAAFDADGDGQGSPLAEFAVTRCVGAVEDDSTIVYSQELDCLDFGVGIPELGKTPDIERAASTYEGPRPRNSMVNVRGTRTEMAGPTRLPTPMKTSRPISPGQTAMMPTRSSHQMRLKYAWRPTLPATVPMRTVTARLTRA
jgi:hypothetical protein